MHALKTGRLIACAVHCGLVLASPSVEIDTALRTFARELGLLFQIVDDILDVAGSEEDLGKAVGGDARHGKVTYVSAHGLDGARALAEQVHGRATQALSPLGDAGADLMSIADLTFARRH